MKNILILIFLGISIISCNDSIVFNKLDYIGAWEIVVVGDGKNEETTKALDGNTKILITSDSFTFSEKGINVEYSPWKLITNGSTVSFRLYSGNSFMDWRIIKLKNNTLRCIHPDFGASNPLTFKRI